MIKRIFIIGILLLSVSFTRAQMLAVKCDLAKGVAMAPNLGVDFVVGEKTTFGVDVFGAKQPWGKEAKMFAISPDIRYWFGGRALIRHYVELSAVVANYDIHHKNKIRDGNTVGAGIMFGRAYKITSHLNFEISGGLVMLKYNQKEYYKGDIYEDYGERTNSKGSLMLPQIEASISYIIR